MTADILKIQESFRKSISNYAIKSKHKEEALVALVSADLYLALEEKEAPAPLKRKPPAPPSEVINLGQTAERN